MKFALRYFKFWFLKLLKEWKPFLVLIGIFSFIIGFAVCYLHEFPYQVLYLPLIYLAGGAVVYVVFVFIFAVIIFASEYKNKKLYNEKGNCPEYIDILKKEYIGAKKRIETNYIVFAGALRDSGDFEAALETVESVDTEKLTVNDRAMYVYTYISIAVCMGNKELALSVLEENRHFINAVISETEYVENTGFIYISLIYVYSVFEQFEKAYETCTGYIESEASKKSGVRNTDLLILKIYLLKKLGREKDMQEAYEEFNRNAPKLKLMFDIDRALLINNAEKAIKGELPI